MNEFVQREALAVSQLKVPLPPHRGEVRYQASLDRDGAYRDRVLVTFAASLIGSSGLGHLALGYGALPAALFCFTVFGFAYRALAPRTRRLESLGRDYESRTILGGIALFGVLGCFLSGTAGGDACLLTCLLAGIVFLVRRIAVLGLLAYLAGAIAMIAEIGMGSSSEGSLGILLPKFGVGAVLAAMAILSGLSDPFEDQPISVLSAMAGNLWIWIAVDKLLAAPWSFIVVLAMASGLWILHAALSRRVIFAPVFIAVMLVHLSGCLCTTRNLLDPVAPQVVIVLLEFCLLAMANYRHAQARLSSYPVSTYRSSPQCLVPTLDHAWDHPVKIDVG
ncbi:MAG: hypothetical protein P4L46_05395 [Fimbriimonas sp.]|nr:hypothetical protein [Fimbriimonas sp.]